MHGRNLMSAAALALIIAFSAYPQCPIHSLVGAWSYVGIGWTVGADSVAVPFTMIGVAVVDESGNVTGPGTFASAAPIAGTPIPAGQALDYELNGALELNNDCTGFLKYNLLLKGLPIPPIGPDIDRVIVNRSKDEIVAMGVKGALAKPMWVYTMKRMNQWATSVAWSAVPAQ
jgi:hypothetical protein